jgi:hypothetical protein
MNQKTFNLALNNMGLEINNFENNIHSEEEVKLYIVSLEKNKKLNDYFNKNKIENNNFIEIKNKMDFNKILEGDIIFILAKKESYNQFIEQILFLKENSNSAVICINSLENYELVFDFLRRITELINIPSLVGIDFADIKNVLKLGNNIIFRKYDFDLEYIDNIIEKINFDFKNIDNCLVIINGGSNLKLDSVNYLVDKIEDLTPNLVYGSTMEDNLGEKIELYFYIIK